MNYSLAYFLLAGLVYSLAIFQGASALDYDYGKAYSFDAPVRDISIIATPEGYYPKSLSAFVGEKLQFFVTATTDHKSCVLISEKGLFLSAQKGKINEGSVIFNRPGVYKFYCPTGKIKGRLTILKRESDEDKAKREIASKSRVRIWLPRDE